ncbi:hypothetical protein SPM24T3_04157 [Serratia sp. M24T3]|nr:hypothetical protein SPM24T3_04157 [Serratia sp. M24T3]
MIYRKKCCEFAYWQRYNMMRLKNQSIKNRRVFKHAAFNLVTDEFMHFYRAVNWLEQSSKYRGTT